MEAAAAVVAVAMVPVRLVADRSPHKDVIYGTGIQWSGRGDIKPVPAPAWLKMRAHVDVYEEAPAGPTLADAAKPANAPLVIPTLGLAPAAIHDETGVYETPEDERIPPRQKPDGRSREARDAKAHAAVVASLKT